MAYEDELLSKALMEYPFVARHNPAIAINPQKNRGFAETYPMNENSKTSLGEETLILKTPSLLLVTIDLFFIDVTTTPSNALPLSSTIVPWIF